MGARGTMGRSKGRRTWPHKGTEPVKSQGANKKHKLSVGITNTVLFGIRAL